MIVSRNTMIEIETASGYTEAELMERAGKACADEIREHISTDMKILILAGKGNNGGDGFVIASQLEKYRCKVVLVDGAPKTDAAAKAYAALSPRQILPRKQLYRALADADVIVDAIYGFSFHGELSAEMKKIFRAVSESNAFIYSIDINSGAECDSGCYDHDAIHSDVTLALDCYKPFHKLRKEHRLFRLCKLLSLDLKHDIRSAYKEMDLDTFLAGFPKKPENAYKGSYGKTLLAGGSYGTAGALSLNIFGAKTVGAPYINVACPEDIYPIVGAQHITPVFHPFSHDSYQTVLEPLIKDAKAIAYGSGAGKLSRKTECLDLILQNAKVPVILDAEALRLLHRNTWILRFTKCPVILTPHIGEFADIINQPIEAVKDHKMEFATAFAKKHKVYLVLKGPNTIAVSPAGEIYINESGNQALAQAGSGDLLTGIMAGILTLTRDIFQAVCMSVWLHGYLAEYGLKDHSIQDFPLTDYPRLMDHLLKENGY